jgi:hypothetical protein
MTVYKIFEEKIHQGYICEFDPKDGIELLSRHLAKGAKGATCGHISKY